MRNIVFYLLTFAIPLVSCGQAPIETPTSASPTIIPPSPPPTTLTSPSEMVMPIPDSPTQTPSATPVGPPTLTPEPAELHGDFPALVYMRAGEVIFSNADGSIKTTLPHVPDASRPPGGSDVAVHTGSVVLAAPLSSTRAGLWIIHPGEAPVGFEIAAEGNWIESTPMTLDGTLIAYSSHGYSPEEVHQLWVVNADGSENRLLTNKTGRFITNPGPFRLAPIEWSADNSKIYLTTNTDSEATPVGLYVADLATGEITTAPTPQVTLWGLSFSADRSRIAYTTFQWIPTVAFPDEGPPFTLNSTNLLTGETTVHLTSDVDHYERPVWSSDGRKIAFTIYRSFEEGDAGLFVLDLKSGTVRTVFLGERGERIIPSAWLGDDIIAYIREGTSQSTFSGRHLLTIRADGSDQHLIEDSGGMYILDVIQSPSL